jgi:predicted nucleic acid-binding protein
VETTEKTKEKEIVSPLAITGYLDTNLIIEHCWWKYFGKGKGKKTKDVELVERGFQRDYDPYISYMTTMELSVHLTDWFLLQKVIQNGFGYPYFRRERMKHSITSRQKEYISSIVREYQESPDAFYIEIDEITKDFFERVKLMIDNYIEIEDAIHFVFAQAAKCKYSATKDDELRVRLQRIISNKIIAIPSPPTLIKPQGLYKLLK